MGLVAAIVSLSKDLIHLLKYNSKTPVSQNLGIRQQISEI